MRVLAVALAYLVYRLPGDDGLPAGISLGLGTLLILFIVVDQVTLRRRERFEMMQVATLIAGVGAIILGLVLVLR